MIELDFSEYKKQAAALKPSSSVEKNVLSYAKSAPCEPKPSPARCPSASSSSQFKLKRTHLLIVGVSLAACLLQFIGIGAHTIHPSSLIEADANAVAQMEVSSPEVSSFVLTDVEMRLFSPARALGASTNMIAIGDIRLVFEGQLRDAPGVSADFMLPKIVGTSLDIEWSSETSSYLIILCDTFVKSDSSLSKQDALALYNELQNIEIAVSNGASTTTYAIENAGSIPVGETESDLRHTDDGYMGCFPVCPVE